MEDFYFSVLVGIATGLIVGILTYFFSLFLRDTLKPWYTRTIYKGIDVSGTWRGGFNNLNEEVKAVFDIKQSAFNLKGVFFAETIYKDNAEESYSNQYKFFGQIKNNLIVINYEAMSNKRTGVGVLILRSSKGGNTLKGHLAHSEDVNAIWSENNFKLKRD